MNTPVISKNRSIEIKFWQKNLKFSVTIKISDFPQDPDEYTSPNIK